MRHATTRSAATETSAPFTPPTFFDISTFNHVAQRLTAQPCAAPRLDASRLPVRSYERISRGGQQKAVGHHGQHGRLGRLANCRPNRQRPCLPNTIGRHGSQRNGTRVSANSTDERGFKAQSIREHPPNPRKSASHSSLSNVRGANRSLRGLPRCPADVAGHRNNLML
jgi:hypothetical protein